MHLPSWLPVWLILAAASAVFFGLQHVLTKKALSDLGLWTTASIWLATAAVFLGPLAFFNVPSEIPLLYWGIVLIRTVLEIIALVCYLKAMKMTDVSFSVPLTTFSPAFVLLLSMPINHEVPSWLGFVGVGLIMLGAIVLEVEPAAEKKERTRFGRLIRHPAFLLMLVTTLLWAVCTSLHKVAIGMTNASFYTGSATIIFAMLIAPIALIFEGKELKAVVRSKRMLAAVLAGAVNTVAFATMIFAQSMTLNATVVAVKHLSPIFAAVFAFWILKEPIKRRIIPTLLMVAGTILFVFA